MHLDLQWPDYVIILLYFSFVVAVGWLVKKKVKTSTDYLMSGRSIPLWITSLAFISANLGAQEVIGMSASGAKYGLMTSHFYWIGAIPAMVFLGLMMMPFYYGSRARSVPEYLRLRFDEKTRSLNAMTFAAMTVFSSGISLFVLARLFELILGWDFDLSVLAAAGIVMAYIFTGGLTSAVYNEVLQFFLIVLGIAPVVAIGLYEVGGWEGITAKLAPVMTSTWAHTGEAKANPMGITTFGLMAGSLCSSFGYWCTDFLVVQRAMIARNLNDSQRTPIIASVPKMLMPIIVIVPGLIAMALPYFIQDFSLPSAKDGTTDYNMALPSLIAHYYPTGLLGVGLVALLASFMSGMAGNVTAFNSVWTYDIYQPFFKKNAPDSHYLRVGKMTTVVGIALSVGVAYMAANFNNINDFLQVVFSFVNAPLFATFLLGMFWKRTTGHGAFAGLMAGTLAAAAVHGLTVAEGKGGWIFELFPLESGIAQAYHIAWVAFTANLVVTWLVSLATKPMPVENLRGLVHGLWKDGEPQKQAAEVWWKRPALLALVVTVAAVILNLIFW